MSKSRFSANKSHASSASPHSEFFHYAASARRAAGNRCEQLLCERVPAAEIAARCQTPVYVYSRAAMEAAYRQFDRAFRGLRHTICYAVKANSNLAVLRLFAGLGSGFDIVSGGELYRLQQIGVRGRRIVYSGVGKTREEIREALRSGLLLFNVESEDELEILASETSRRSRPAPAALRVNPDLEAGAHPHIATGRHRHKFGLEWAVARRLYLAHRGSRWIRWQGISVHIGSQVLSVAPFHRAARLLAGYVRDLARAGVVLRWVDIGGGMGVRYFDEKVPSAAEYARAIIQPLRPLGCRLILEPGRALVGSAGVLLTRVLRTKVASRKGPRFVVVDAAMNDFIRPALYNAIHPMTPVERHPERLTTRVDVVGPVCETGDSFLSNWRMEMPERGELLALWGAGAYGFVEASNYNSRPRAPEVLVDGGRFRVIRRRESRTDLIRGELTGSVR